ncbi:endonuclease/exonuclease/phosphatase family protein [Saccharicrinis carchari]|nr:endonuclease/exonuclease/phosphatase family protein [Saccharicrinis carchari]
MMKYVLIKGLFVASLLLIIFSFDYRSSDSRAYDKSDSVKDEVNKFSKDPSAIRILSYNVKHCEGMDRIINYNRIGHIISSLNADFICLQELDSCTTRSNNIDQLLMLSEETQMNGYFGKAIFFQNGKYGVGILSKESAISTYNYSLPGDEARTVLVAEYPNLVIMSTHLGLKEENRLESIKILTDKAKEFSKPVFMAGDFNENNFTGDVFNELNKNWTLISAKENTFSTGSPKVCIDFVFSLNNKEMNTTENLGSSVVYALPDVNVSIASDHYPVFTDVKIN